MRDIKKRFFLFLVVALIIQLLFLSWPRPSYAGGCVSDCVPFLGDTCMCEWCEYLGFPFDVSVCILNFCTCGSGPCFTGETEIGIKNSKTQKLQIKDLKPGDVVESFNPETGEIMEGTVSDVTKLTRQGYYVLETESGEKVKVTAEHPFLAVKNQELGIMNNELIEKVKDIFPHTLTYRVITGLQAKVAEILH
jgi:hypothetical protein